MKTETLKNLKDVIVTLISTPKLGDDFISSLQKKESSEIIKTFYNWLNKVSEMNNKIIVNNFNLNNDLGSFTLLKPIETKMSIICSNSHKENFDINFIENYIKEGEFEFLFILSTNPSDTLANNSIIKSDKIIFVDYNWLASIIIGNSKPFFAQLGVDNQYEWSPYIKEKTTNAVSSNTDKNIDYVFFKQNQKLSKGDVFSVKASFPLITIPVTFVRRFYKNLGKTDSDIEAILDNRAQSIENWKKHINNYRNNEIVSLHSLKQHIINPEYLGLSLTNDELLDQISNLKTLLRYDNYNFCLTTKAVDINYELKNSQVFFNSALSNKPDNIMSLNISINDSVVYNQYEKDFNTTFDTAAYKDTSKSDILDYITSLYNQFSESREQQQIINETLADVKSAEYSF